MPFRARQIATSTTAVPLLVQGTSGTSFPNILGSLQDPVPVTIKNESATQIVYVGGPDVSATLGQSIAAGGSETYNLYGADIPYAWSSAAGTVSVLAGRQ